MKRQVTKMTDIWKQAGVETSADIIMPLPLTQEGIRQLPLESLTQEVADGTAESMYPGVQLPGNLKITVLPIVPGITMFSYIRFFNAYPGAGSVDVYVNGRKVASNLLYRNFTEYMKAFPGYYRVAVFRAGTTENPLTVSYINLIGYRIYTAALTGTEGNVSLEMINDNRRFLQGNMAYVRFVQLSANAPRMDVYLDDSLVLSDLNYKEVSRYMAVVPGEHNLKLREYFSGAVLLEDPVVTLKGGKAYTIYVVGDMNDRVGLQVVIPLEGASYLAF